MADLQYFQDLKLLNDWFVEIIAEMKREQKAIEKASKVKKR